MWHIAQVKICYGLKESIDKGMGTNNEGIGKVGMW